MPLLNLFQKDPDQINALALNQVINLAGDGTLRDGSECAQEFRDFLRQASLELLETYVRDCLVPGSKNGLALQDIVNELGNRLGYVVEHGRYQGVKGEIGFDGIWVTQDRRSTLIIEVKTTDAYRINLETIVGYRNKLEASGQVDSSATVLIVVGREDTGDLEAQVRGSKYAWEVRILGVEALVRLCYVKLKTDFETQSKISQLLTPFEYTRLDRIIDITFSAVEETNNEGLLNPPKDNALALNEGQASVNIKSPQVKSGREEIDQIRKRLIAALALRENKVFLPESQAMFRSSDGQMRIACSASKVYDDGGSWYAYHPKWDEYLGGQTTSYLCLAIVGRNHGYCIPREALAKALNHF